MKLGECVCVQWNLSVHEWPAGDKQYVTSNLKVIGSRVPTAKSEYFHGGKNHWKSDTVFVYELSRGFKENQTSMLSQGYQSSGA